MMIRKKYFAVSLYILVPLTFGGLSLICVLLTERLHGKADVMFDWALGGWKGIVFLMSVAVSLLITWLVLRPATKFIKKAESLPVLSRQFAPEENQPKDSLEHFSRVFDEVTNVLGKVEARELFPRIVGQSKVMRGIFTQILKVAPTDSTVLISGESGTGKEIIATGIYEHSLRRGKPFVKINCVAIPENLLESELFGYEKGAFTGATSQKIGRFEAAHRGTVFLDEIGDMPLVTQAKILRILQEKEFERLGGNKTIKIDVRIIAATNKNLPEMVARGLFREDLYYRINVFSIHLPPLRERKEDIPYLVDYLLENMSEPVRLSPQALQVVISCAWPGNIRELQNAIERAAVLTEDGIIEPGHLPADIISGITEEPPSSGSPDELSLDRRLDEIEKGLIIEALKRTGGVQVKAAEVLGINQRSLWHRIKKHRIDTESLKQLQKM